MADVAASMLRAALDAFTRGDAAAARRVIEQDDEIDVMYERLFRDLIDLMVSEPSATPRAARLLFVAKHLERIADYVTDICELTVYMAEAAVIKHSY
jgi:phosphate transport system protein